jgi:hypothetical protein
MKRDIRKEIIFGLRSSRFLILLTGLLFFAVSTPVMVKVLLPEILKSQFPGMSEQALADMLDMTQLGCIRSYMGDVFEIGSIIVAFTLCGLIAQEIKDNTLVLPLCSGKRFAGIVGAKFIVFGVMLVLAPTFAIIVDYLYSGLLFSFEIGIMPIIRSGLLQGGYMLFLLASLIMWGSLTKKPIATGFLTLLTVFGTHFIGSTLKIQEFLPSGLLEEAQMLAVIPASTLIQTVCITVGIILTFTAITMLRLKSMEWNER